MLLPKARRCHACSHAGDAAPGDHHIEFFCQSPHSKCALPLSQAGPHYASILIAGSPSSACPMIAGGWITGVTDLVTVSPLRAQARRRSEVRLTFADR